MKYEDREKDFYVVDIILKENRGTLNNGILFYNIRKGEKAIQDKDILIEILESRNEITKGDVPFQNRYINTIIRAGNIESYNIRVIKLKDF